MNDPTVWALAGVVVGWVAAQVYIEVRRWRIRRARWPERK